MVDLSHESGPKC